MGEVHASGCYVSEGDEMNDTTLELVAVAVVAIALVVAVGIGAYMWAVTLF